MSNNDSLTLCKSLHANPEDLGHTLCFGTVGARNDGSTTIFGASPTLGGGTADIGGGGAGAFGSISTGGGGGGTGMAAC